MQILLRRARGQLRENPVACIRRGEKDGWTIFNEQGQEINAHLVRPISAIETAVSFGEGVWWLFWFYRDGVHVRSYVVTDRYPIGNKETLETDIVLDFTFAGRAVEDVENMLKAPVECGGKVLHYPPPLIEAILAVGARAQKGTT